jgi:hypothetical protein
VIAGRHFAFDGVAAVSAELHAAAWCHVEGKGVLVPGARIELA